MFQYQAPTPDRKIKVTYGRGPSRKLDSTVQHLEKGGLPVNPVVLGSIKRKLDEGIYQGNRDSLIQDLKSDPALFLYSAKQLRTFGETAENGIRPETLLRNLDDSQLKKIFSVTEREISAHRTRNMSKVQALRLQHSVVSSRAAEAMAEGAHIEPEVAYSGALFRQLGLNLIAWNYPEIYAAAIRKQKLKKATLEEELERLLGVNPTSIGTRFANEWNIDPEIKRALIEDKQDQDLDAEESTNEKLSLQELCGLAELFAQTNDTEFYPEAQQSWAIHEPKARKLCNGDLGTTIAEKVKISLESFESCSTQVFPTNLIDRPQITNNFNDKARFLFDHNSNLRRCSSVVQANIVGVYERIEDTPFSVNALKYLVDQVVTQIGFVRGCLYLLDEKELLIKPAMRIGDLPINSYTSFRMFQNNIVTTSLDTTVPIKQEGDSMDGIRRLRVCGGLGSNKHPGVLYLEADRAYFEQSESDPVVIFHAIRQALLDCLDPAPHNVH